MDGKGRATDNAYIERWFRTIKQKYIYLNPEKMALTFTKASPDLPSITIAESIKASAADNRCTLIKGCLIFN